MKTKIIKPTKLSDLPKDTQKELKRIVKMTRSAEKQVEMIILFGSYARGEAVEDQYMEDSILYEYLSDLDILILVATEKLEQSYATWHRLENQLERDQEIKTPVSLLVDTVEWFNRQIVEQTYFYTDIRQQGITLYDSKKYTLEDPSRVRRRKKKAMMVRDQELWFDEKAEEFFTDFKNAFNRGSFKIAAFYLHQALESYYVSFLLVATGYRLKTHDLVKIRRKVELTDERFKDAFPLLNEHEKKLFSLLRRAYVDARYKPSFKIEEQDLLDLEKRVASVRDLVKRLNDEYIQT